MADRYLEALKQIPRGETRTFMELAAMAGRPGAARAAGRAVRAARESPDASRLPWHRVVAADGRLIDDARSVEQLTRLRREGSRPRDGESVASWTRRRAPGLVGKLPDRVFLPADDARVSSWGPLRVEPLTDHATALSRGFRPAEGDATLTFGASRRRRGRTRSRPVAPIGRRLAALDTETINGALRSTGVWSWPRLLSSSECDRILSESDRAGRFERSVEMLPKGYGVGNYHYWKEPIPAPLPEIREYLYDTLHALACELDPAGDYPRTLAGFWRRCRAAGQRRASSILIQYPTRGVNHPHRDIYGKVWFPFQALLVLSRAGRDFEGGEFVLIEEHASGDVRREIPVSEGDLVVFCSRSRWEHRGNKRRKLPLMHAMNPITTGEREAIGLVFHLAE